MSILDMTNGQYELTPAPEISEEFAKIIEEDQILYLAYLESIEEGE